MLRLSVDTEAALHVPPVFSVDSCPVWLLIRGYINHLCGHTPTDLRMGAPIPTTNFARLSVTLTETHCKAAVNSPFQSGRNPNKVEDWLGIIYYITR
jgi:hypothetical protein